MIIYFNNRHPRNRISRRYLEKKIKIILNHLHLKKAVLGISFVTNREIAHLNQKYLHKKGPTDVLSFPLEEKDFLGDVVLAVDIIARQSKKQKVSLRERSLYLIIHGVLHLLGYDHKKEKDWVKMEKKQQELMKVSVL